MKIYNEFSINLFKTTQVTTIVIDFKNFCRKNQISYPNKFLLLFSLNY